MAWYDEAVFYHIYPLGLTGAPAENPYGEPVSRLNTLLPWIEHVRKLGCTALYIGPLFESVGHGYETTDYRKLDSRLGTNEDLKQFVRLCHASGIRVVLDAVFNHTGRDFFAFRDLRVHREQSRYRDWYRGVYFGGNNEYNDGFSYENWGGYNLLVKLNLQNPEVREYLLDTVRFWISEFDIDGLRLDAADVLDFDFMRCLRDMTDNVKEDFWLMGEVIHGDYTRWVNERTLHSVTNYHLHKALYSAHNDHNYFEIAHTVKRQLDMGLGSRVRLYNFTDNHDTERIFTRLQNKAHWVPTHILLYTLPGIPSVYYGSEFGIEGRKIRGSDASLRPCLDLGALHPEKNSFCRMICTLGQIRRSVPDLIYGAYRELQLTTTKYAFARGDTIVTVNNAESPVEFDLNLQGSYLGALSGRTATAENGRLRLELERNSGEIWLRQKEGQAPISLLQFYPTQDIIQTECEMRSDAAAGVSPPSDQINEVCEMAEKKSRPTGKATLNAAVEKAETESGKRTAERKTGRKAQAAEPAAPIKRRKKAEAKIKTEDVSAAVLEADAALPETEEAPAVQPAAEEAAEVPAADAAEEILGVGAETEEAPAETESLPEPRRSIAFIGSECYPFVKTGGLGDVMYALPRALSRMNCDVKVILPRYSCIPKKYQEKMVYRGDFMMDLFADGRRFYVGIMEYVWDGVVYDFIDNEEFFSSGNPYTNLVDDIPKYCYFSKAALAALNYMNWIPDVIHCHDWQAALVPVYLKTLFAGTPVGGARTMLTIHNLRFQGIYSIPAVKYWSGLPDHLFNIDVLKQGYNDANLMKAGLAYTDMITTVSGTYAGEIQTPFYGENLDAHMRHHSWKLRGIVNGIDTDIWNSRTDSLLASVYGDEDAIEKKKENKKVLQEQLGLEQDEGKFVIGLISRLTDQKGLDLVNAILPQLIDGNTQVAVLGTGDAHYEDSFRYYEATYKGSVCSSIMYDEGRAHQIYAGADALLVPSLFEPCGLTQLIAMRYGTVPIVRETGGLKDTVQPYNEFTDDGNGFTFDRYEAGLLLDAVNRAKTLYFTEREHWDGMVLRDMAKDVSWENSAKQYRSLYLELRP